MEDKNLEEALQYALGSNKLEDLNLSPEEIEKLMIDLRSGKSDESFLYSLIQASRLNEEVKSVDKGEKKYVPRKQ